MIQVAEKFQVLVERTPGLVVHLVEARRRLEGQPTSDLLSMPHNNLMEGAIVLEEFIKVIMITVVCYSPAFFPSRNCVHLFMQIQV